MQSRNKNLVVAGSFSTDRADNTRQAGTGAGRSTASFNGKFIPCKRPGKYFLDFMSIANISPNLLILIAILMLLVFFHSANENDNNYEKTTPDQQPYW